MPLPAQVLELTYGLCGFCNVNIHIRVSVIQVTVKKLSVYEAFFVFVNVIDRYFFFFYLRLLHHAREKLQSYDKLLSKIKTENLQQAKTYQTGLNKYKVSPSFKCFDVNTTIGLSE